MRATAPGEAVVELPWLGPGAAALAALARTPVPWSVVREDPGTVLLVLRHTGAFATPALPFSLAHLLDPSLAEAALRGLREYPDAGFVDWERDGAREVRAAALALRRAGAAARRDHRSLSSRNKPGSAACWLPWAGSASAPPTPTMPAIAWPTGIIPAGLPGRAAPLGPGAGGAGPPTGPALGPAALAGRRRRLPRTAPRGRPPLGRGVRPVRRRPPGRRPGPAPRPRPAPAASARRRRSPRPPSAWRPDVLEELARPALNEGQGTRRREVGDSALPRSTCSPIC